MEKNKFMEFIGESTKNISTKSVEIWDQVTKVNKDLIEKAQGMSTVVDSIKELGEKFESESRERFNKIYKEQKSDFEKLQKKALCSLDDVLGTINKTFNERFEILNKTMEKIETRLKNFDNKAENLSADVPWEDYDKLSVKKIMSRVNYDDLKTLNKVREYETLNKNRASLMGWLDKNIEDLNK